MKESVAQVEGSSGREKVRENRRQEERQGQKGNKVRGEKKLERA